MELLTRFIEGIGALLVVTGIPAGESTLYALILIYLLVSVFLAVTLFVLLRRRRSAPRRVPSSDQES